MTEYVVTIYLDRRTYDLDAMLGPWLKPGRDDIRFDGLYHENAHEAIVGVLRKLRAVNVPFGAIRNHYCRPATYTGWRDEVAR